MTEGADRANGVGRGASRGDVSETPAVLTLCIPIRGVCAFDGPGAGEKAYGGAHCWDVAGMDGDDNGGGSLTHPGLGVRVEVSGGEDAYLLGVEDRLRKAGEKLVWVFREEGNGEGVDGKLGFVGGEAEGQPARFSHWEGLVELGGECVKVRCECGSGGGRVGDEQGDGPTIVDLGRDRKGEDTVCIPKDTSSYIRESGSYQGSLLVLGGGRAGSVESSFGRRERLRWLGYRHAVAG